MPIAVKDYNFQETEKIVFITVPLKGVKTNKVDIFSTEQYIKVHYPPYLFECFLYAPVCDSKSAAEVGNGAVVFKLEKQETELWSQLQHPDAGDKTKQKEMRELAQFRYQQRIEEDKKEKAEKKRANEKFGISQQMKLEQEEKQRIEDAKESERRQATEELERWKEQQQKMAQEEREKEKERRMKEEEERLREVIANEEKMAQTNKEKKANIFHEEAGDAPLRETGVIGVSFTPRTFPTPSRESVAPEEEAWLKKQAEVRKVAEIQDKDLSEEEKNPVWLRDKGISFFKAGDYQAAISAFSHAIRLSPKMPALFSNRAACHLKLNNLIKSVEDSSKALDLLTPPVPQNAASRCKAHVRRGTAFCQLEMYVEGLLDYDAALKLDPSNETLKYDADRIRQIIQGSTTS